MKKERWLIKITDGTVYTWNPTISRRNDMKEISPEKAHAIIEGKKKFTPVTDTNTYNGNIEYDMEDEKKRLFDAIEKRKGNVGAGMVGEVEVTERIVAEAEKVPELIEGKTEPKEAVKPEKAEEAKEELPGLDINTDEAPAVKKFTKQEASSMTRANKSTLIDALKKTCGIKVSEFDTTKSELLTMIKENTA